MTEGVTMETFIYGDKIRDARKRKHMSAETLGEKLNPPVTYAAVYAWEKGKNEPSVTYLVQLCDILGTDFSDFVNIPQSEGHAERAELADYMKRMNETQRTAVLGVARAMVEC